MDYTELISQATRHVHSLHMQFPSNTVQLLNAVRLASNDPSCSSVQREDLMRIAMEFETLPRVPARTLPSTFGPDTMS